MFFKNYINKKPSTPRIFLGFTEIAGYYKNLCDGFEKLGIETCFVAFNQHQFAYQTKANKYFLVKVLQFLFHKRTTALKSKTLRIIYFLLFSLTRFILFIWACLKFDTFILIAGSSFFPETSLFNLSLLHKELPILKKLGKKIIFVFHGSDERPPYLDGNFQDEDLSSLFNLVKQKKKQLKYIEKYADEIISHIPSSQFHEKKILNWLRIGIPFSELNLLNNIDNEQGKFKKVRILHCPSHLVVKGTLYIRQVIAELKHEGFDFEYIEISGRPNKEVISAIQTADFIIDQIYSDTPLAGLATEAAWYGKPSIVTGYELDKLKSLLNEKHIPPSLNGNPEQLKQLIILLIEDKNLRNSLALKAQNFVKSKWSSEKVAKRYLKIINSEIPVSWYFLPQNYNFSYGVGISNTTRRKLFQKLYNCYGLEAFQLNDKPELENIILSSLKDEDAIQEFERTILYEVE